MFITFKIKIKKTWKNREIKKENEILKTKEKNKIKNDIIESEYHDEEMDKSDISYKSNSNANYSNRPQINKNKTKSYIKEESNNILNEISEPANNHDEENENEDSFKVYKDQEENKDNNEFNIISPQIRHTEEYEDDFQRINDYSEIKLENEPIDIKPISVKVNNKRFKRPTIPKKKQKEDTITLRYIEEKSFIKFG